MISTRVRCGGLVPDLSHLFTEASGHLLAAAPSGLLLGLSAATRARCKI